MFRLPGAFLLDLAQDLGGGARTAWSLARAMRHGIDWLDLVRALNSFGLGSLAVASLTAAFTGGMLVVQAGLYVRELGANMLVGFGTGYTMFREVGPFLLALVFAGRVGSRNTAELAAMATTDQFAALHALGVDPLRAVAAPRAVAVVIALVGLVFVADVVAMAGGAVAARTLLGVTPGEFLRSAQAHLGMADILNGAAKAVVFSAAIAVISTREGLAAEGGASQVGNAAGRSVVHAAMTIIVMDLFLTSVLP